MTPSINTDVGTFINVANWTYSQGSDPLPDGLTFLTDKDQRLELYDAGTGFYGAALLTQQNQVIVGFEGTNLYTGDATFTAAQLIDDAAISAGLDAPSYATALSFTQSAIKVAADKGIGAGDMFITGHSLGGAEAQYVAAQLDLPGVTFGGPGIPAADTNPDRPSKLTSYVEHGDPVGNYAANPPRYLGSIVSSDTIRHFGGQSLIGLSSGISVDGCEVRPIWIRSSAQAETDLVPLRLVGNPSAGGEGW